MNKKKSELVWRYAELIHENLCLKTNCFNANGQVKKVTYIACVDDDPKSAVFAAQLYHQAVKEGQEPSVLCIGGVGLLSKHLKKKGAKRYTEGMRLAEFCMRLGVPVDRIIILDKGTNTGENIRDVAEQLLREFGDIVFALTKRLSLRWERSFKRQIQEHMALVMAEKYHHEYFASQIKVPQDYYYVIEEKLEEACCWLNGKKCGKNQMMFHELASIYDRCVVNRNEKFQLPLEFEVSADVVEAATYLAKHYRLKNGKMGLREIYQYISLKKDLKNHFFEMAVEERNIIFQKRYEFSTAFGVNFKNHG